MEWIALTQRDDRGAVYAYHQGKYGFHSVVLGWQDENGCVVPVPSAGRGDKVQLSTAELAAIPLVAALIEAARDASALLDEVASDTVLDTSGIADALDVALAALGADQ